MGATVKSLPSRGAWIEIPASRSALPGSEEGRSPHGERGLKYPALSTSTFSTSRSPHGERGLKFILPSQKIKDKKSLPSRGAWIEIFWYKDFDGMAYSRSPHGERGLK